MPNFNLTDEVFQGAAAQFPTPFHLYDEAGIRRNARALKAAFSWCEDFQEYFAVKALPNPTVLRILQEEGCGVDCSSETELLLSEALGFAGRDVMFSANNMPPQEFEHARAMGAYVNLDDITHIDILKEHGGIPECICCRYNPGGDFKIGTAIMGNPGDAKYGFTYPQLQEGLKRLKELGAKEFGLHAFLSSNNTDNSYYPTLAKIMAAPEYKAYNKLYTGDPEKAYAAEQITEYEPSAEEVFNYLIPKYVEMELYASVIESATCEHAARRTAMESATDNAREMLSNLNLQYNRARQAAITDQIIEIVAGAEAQN